MYVSVSMHAHVYARYVIKVYVTHNIRIQFTCIDRHKPYVHIYT